MEVIYINLCVSIILIIERLLKYYLKHLKKSKCCGNEIEFQNV